MNIGSYSVRWITRWGLCLVLTVVGPALNAATETETAALRSAVTRNDNRIYLIIERHHLAAANAYRGTVRRIGFLANERIERQMAWNQLAVVVTNKRFLAYSAARTRWQIKTRQVQERTLSMRTEGNTALVFTTQRILTFSGATGRWSSSKR